MLALLMREGKLKKQPIYIRKYRPQVGERTVGELVRDVFTQYVEEVREGKFPGEENVHKVDLVEFDLIKKTLADMGIVTIPPSESSCR